MIPALAPTASYGLTKTPATKGAVLQSEHSRRLAESPEHSPLTALTRSANTDAPSTSTRTRGTDGPVPSNAMLAINIALSYGSAAILHAVAYGRQFGFDIMDATGLTSGTVYPALDRLETAGYLIEVGGEAARAEGRPARRYFTLTASGATALRAALEKYKALRPLAGFSPEEA